MLFFASDEIAGIKFKIFSSGTGIRKILMNEEKVDEKTQATATKLYPDDPFMFNVFEQLREYFNGKRKVFEVPIEYSGSAFQEKVWNILLKIPYGRTVTYKFIAQKLGDEKNVRAVGKANGSNPIPIIIPCHRVINTNGSLGGYSCGIEIKEKLLKLEGSLSPELFE
jgi:methylated-DNA-[protein]-cysteine S-methyltransferase